MYIHRSGTLVNGLEGTAVNQLKEKFITNKYFFSFWINTIDFGTYYIDTWNNNRSVTYFKFDS